MEDQQKIEENAECKPLDLLIIMSKRKKFILGGTILLAVLTTIIVCIMTPIYEARTQLMPPQDSSGSSLSGLLLGQLGGASGISLPFSGGGGTSSDLYVGLLETRAILDPIIDRFDLMTLYNWKTRERARKALAKKIMKANADKKSGIITIMVEGEDPQRAADIANAFVEQLKKLLDGLAVTDAAKRRLFFEEQLKQAIEGLSRAEEAFQQFQKTTGAIKLDDQAAAVMKGMGDLKAAIVAKEIQIRVMKKYSTENNRELKLVEEELKGLKDQMSQFEARDTVKHPDLFLPTEQIPVLGTEYLRRVRELKFSETMYELIVKQYQGARLDEAREAAIVQVIHKAIPPDEKIRPKRGLLIILSIIIGFFLLSFIACVMEYYEKFSEVPANARRIAELKEHLRRPWLSRRASK